MNNTMNSLLNIFSPSNQSEPEIASNSSNYTIFEWPKLTDSEKKLWYGILVVTILLILQSVCFLLYVLRVRLRRRKKQRIKTKREETSDSVETVRYSQQPLKQPTDPEIYESLKDIDEAPPPPSIDTLPKKKVPIKKQLSSPVSAFNDNELSDRQTNTLRPRLPLPHEVEAPPLLPKSDFATMPRTPQLHKAPPIMMSTLPSRQRSPLRIQHGLNSPTTTKPNPPPHPSQSSGHHSSCSDSKSMPRSPMEFPQTRSPPEPNILPSSQREYMSNSLARVPQQIKEPDIDNELLQKLRKRAAMIPDSSNTFNDQTTHNSIPRDTRKFYKPLPPTPRVSDYGWVENFDEIEPLEQINMYNI